MDFGNIINNLLDQMAFFHLEAGNYVMIVVALAADSDCIRYAAG